MLHTLKRAAQAPVKAAVKSVHKPVEAAPGLPLYDSKPRWWARWAYGLLALDILFTTMSCDTIMSHWTQRVEVKPASTAIAAAKASAGSGTDKKPDPTASDKAVIEWELRPFWQRLSLAAGQLVVGAAVGAGIMAFRDRTIWRLHILPAISASKGASKSTPKGASKAAAAAARDMRWVRVETGSGRTKHFMMRDCALGAGRDDTEMVMRIRGIRGQFWVGMTQARVLGQEGLPVAEVRRRLLMGWGSQDAQAAQWTKGPVVQ